MSLNDHSRGRMKQRVGIKKGYKAEEKANRAFRDGIPREKMTGSLRRWVDRKYFRHNLSHTCLVYEGKLYVFDRNRLLKTVIPVPQRFLREVVLGAIPKQAPRVKKPKNVFSKQRKFSEASFL